MTGTAMALILAIEPNENQAQQIAQLVKQHVKRAQLVTEASADAALAALGDRIPDLILTPALLPSRDEAALTDRLRQLGAAAAHIHTLAVPIIAAAKTCARDTSGLLGRRRDKAEAEDTAGCEPGVFAEQIKVYLDRAARERETQAPQPETTVLADDFDELVWLPDALPSPTPPAPVGGDTLATPLPPVALATLDDPSPAAPLVKDEKRHPRIETPATRAFEAEFGLPPSASTSPPLWRVAEEGIEALTVPEPAAVVYEPPALVSPHAPSPAPVKTNRKALPPTRQTPPLDDWAFFDPQQSMFKALIKRLDQITADAGRSE